MKTLKRYVIVGSSVFAGHIFTMIASKFVQVGFAGMDSFDYAATLGAIVLIMCSLEYLRHYHHDMDENER